MTFIYFILVHLYYLLLLAVSPFNHKGRLWITGRWGWRSELKEWCKPGQQVLWFHAASLGEFEQGRPLIENIRRKYSQYQILLTFYSPSGFEVRKNYPGADHVMYLPLDTPYNARLFVNAVNPVAAIFIKYEFWPFFLRKLRSHHYPVFLISGIFRPGQVFFNWYGAWFRKALSCIDFFYVQDETSARLLKEIGITACQVTGDTRFDRVAAVAASSKEIDAARIFSEDHFCLVAGSTWPEDEELLAHYISQSDADSRFIIAPHEITRPHLDQLAERMPRPYALFSQFTNGMRDLQVLIIDNIGMLSSLYRYGSIAYIGGGFGKGIHNILEAAAFGIPVIFGPNYLKFREACELISLGGAYSVRSAEELSDILQQLRYIPSKYEKASRVAGKYVIDNTGSTDLIMYNLFDRLSSRHVNK